MSRLTSWYEIAKQAANVMAKEAIGFKEEDKKDYRRLKELRDKAEIYIEQVIEKIDATCETMEEMYDGIEIPIDIFREQVAKNISVQANQTRITDVNQIRIDQEARESMLQESCELSRFSMDDINMAIYSRNIDKCTFFYEDVPSITAAAINIRGTILPPEVTEKYPLNTEIEDQKYSFQDYDDQDMETVVEWQKANITELMKYAEQDPKNVDKIREAIILTPGGLGIDAGLRYFAEELNRVSYNKDGTTTRDGVAALMNSQEKLDLFKTVIKQAESNPKFKDDKFTTAHKLTLITCMLEENRKSELPVEIINQLKDMDPKAFKLVSRNLDTMIKLCDQKDENEVKSPFNAEVFAQESYDSREFLTLMEQKVNNIAQENGLIVIDNQPIFKRIFLKIKEVFENARIVGQQTFRTGGLAELAAYDARGIEDSALKTVEKEKPTVEKPTIEEKPKITAAQKFANLKMAMMGKMKSKGVELLSDFAITNIEGKEDINEKKMFGYAAIEALQETKEMPEYNADNARQARKQLFKSIIENNIDNGEVINKMAELDIDAAKELISEYTVSDNPRALNLVFSLGKAIGKVSKGENTNGTKESKSAPTDLDGPGER